VTSSQDDWIDPDIDRYVMAALIRDGQEVLLLRRRADDFLGGLYELPSGVLEAGETGAEALVREVLEETGLTVTAIGPVSGWFDYRSKSGRATRQVNFPVRVGAGEVTLTEHDDFRWVAPGGLGELEVSAETRATIESGWSSAAAVDRPV
jgi:8-oxo-dGTP diphosphatase